MTYQYIDAPANRDSVISDMVSFAVSNGGFTNEGDDGDLRRISRGGFYLSLINRSIYSAACFEIACRMTDTLPTASTWSTAAGQYKSSGMGLHTQDGPYTGMHLFTDGNEISAALEIVPDVFVHLSFGFPSKFGTWTGGAYISGQIYQTHPTSNYGWPAWQFCTTTADIGTYDTHRAASNYANAFNYQGEWIREGGSFINSKRMNWGAYDRGYSSALFNAGWAAYNYRRPLLPLYTVIQEDGSQDRVVAVSNQVRLINLEGLMNKEVIESDWMVFPWCQRTAIAYGFGTTGNWGMAYKK